MKKLLCALALAICSLPLRAGEPQVLKVGFREDLRQYQPLMTAIYHEAGLIPEYVLQPPERSLRSVDSGSLDADIGRAAGTLYEYPNVIEGTESILELHVQAVVRKDFGKTRLEPGELLNYRLGHVRGAKAAESLVRSLGLQADQANTLQQILQMVAAGRIDVGLGFSVTPLSAFPEFKDRLITLPQPLYTIRTVHVMNKKWASLMPKIDAAIRSMKADGRLARLLPKLAK